MSSQNRAILLLLKGGITELSADDQAKVQAAAAALRKVVTDYGDVGYVAFALVSAEFAIAEEKSGS